MTRIPSSQIRTKAAGRSGRLLPSSNPLLLATALLCVAWIHPAAANVGGSIAMEPRVSIPRPANLETEVQFWVRIYSEVTTSEGLIHDNRHLGVVYERVDLKPGQSYRSRERATDRVKSGYRTILRNLAKGKRDGLSREEARVLALWPEGTSNRELRDAAGRLRFQLGQADKFRAGIIRSGEWKDYIEDTLREHGLPTELAALPHVESSFTPHAYSRIGAAGLWQFTRSTGRRFMRIDHVVDERLDPFRATQSAARLLKQNRETTGSWPLAITAYNHGAAGMRRAVRKLGTRDIDTIVRKYNGRTFGFASRNFYVEFLAALDVSQNYRRYFGELELNEPVDYEIFSLSFYTKAHDLVRALGIDESEFKSANPAFRPAVWRGAKYIPRKMSLRMPRVYMTRSMDDMLASIPSVAQHAAQTRDLTYKVRRGDALSTIARRFHVRVSDLVAINGLRSRHRIRVGQILKLPDNGRSSPARVNVAKSDPIEVPADGRYTVRRGDTVEGIATRFNLSEQQILSANSLRNRNRIYVGQTLFLTETKPEESPAVAATHPDAVAILTPPPERPSNDSVATQATPVLAVASPEEAAQPVAAAGDVELAEARETDGGLGVVHETMPSLSADPSEYGVASNGTIEVQGAETLGHYADWLEVRTSRLREINKLKYGRVIAIGQRIKIDDRRVSSEEFEARRRQYHADLQENFFDRFEIDGTQTHVTRSGDSLWLLTERKYQVPLWLLRQYNPDIDFAALQKGTQITVPQVKQRENWTPGVAAGVAKAS